MEIGIGEQPGYTPVSIEKGMDPCQPVMAGYGSDQFAVTSMPLGSINLGESLQKPVEDDVPRRDVATDPDILLAQLAGQHFVPIPCLRVFERAQDPRQTLVEPVVEPAQELGITDLELRFVHKPLFHILILLDFDVDPAFARYRPDG